MVRTRFLFLSLGGDHRYTRAHSERDRFPLSSFGELEFFFSYVCMSVFAGVLFGCLSVCSSACVSVSLCVLFACSLCSFVLCVNADSTHTTTQALSLGRLEDASGVAFSVEYALRIWAVGQVHAF